MTYFEYILLVLSSLLVGLVLVIGVICYLENFKFTCDKIKNVIKMMWDYINSLEKTDK